MAKTMLLAARAEALFLSGLQPSQTLTLDEVAAAIRASLHTHHGVHGCAGDVAAEFGDHPDTSVARMRWALTTVTALYPARPAVCANMSLRPAGTALVGATR